MPDLVVTVPKPVWKDWILEGDAAGEPETGEEWGYFTGGFRPNIQEGDRLYIVSWGMLRGYAPVTRVAKAARGWAICRRGGAVAVTIDEAIPGFRGARRRWWDREAERPFEAWRTRGVGEDAALAVSNTNESPPCYAVGCNVPVPPRMLMCRKHLFSVPRDLQTLVWREYREGQEEDKRPSPRYLVVQRAAVEHVARKEGRTESAEAARRDKDLYRTQCRHLGIGDPLEGTRWAN